MRERKPHAIDAYVKSRIVGDLTRDSFTISVQFQDSLDAPVTALRLRYAPASEDHDLTKDPRPSGVIEKVLGGLDVTGGELLEIHSDPFPEFGSGPTDTAVGVDTGGETIVGPQMPIWSTVAKNQEASHLWFFDCHHGQAISQGVGGEVRRMFIQRSIQNASAQVIPNGNCSRVGHVGDGPSYGKYNKKAGIEAQKKSQIFPVNEHGMPDPQYVQHYEQYQSQADADTVVDKFREDYADVLKNCALTVSPGNHDAVHSWGKSTDWSWTAMREKLKIPTKLAHLNPSSWYKSNDPEGKYYAYTHGNTLVCIANAYCATTTKKASPEDQPAWPTDPEDPPAGYDLWTLGQQQWDFFFHADSGVIVRPMREEDFVLFVIHNLTGGKKGTPSKHRHYGRGGVHYALHGDWGAHPDWTNPHGHPTGSLEYGTLGVHGALRHHAKGECIVLKGHDHCGEIANLQGVWYVTAPKPTGSEHNPYSVGFVADGAYDQATVMQRTLFFGPGWGLTEHLQTDLKFKFFRTFLTQEEIAQGITEPVMDVPQGNPVQTERDVYAFNPDPGQFKLKPYFDSSGALANYDNDLVVELSVKSGVQKPVLV